MSPAALAWLGENGENAKNLTRRDGKTKTSHRAPHNAHGISFYQTKHQKDIPNNQNTQSKNVNKIDTLYCKKLTTHIKTTTNRSDGVPLNGIFRPCARWEGGPAAGFLFSARRRHPPPPKQKLSRIAAQRSQTDQKMIPKMTPNCGKMISEMTQT
jgi:hypothetical protein